MNFAAVRRPSNSGPCPREIDGALDGFVDRVFAQGADVEIPPSACHKRDYVDRALRGGYPEAVRP